MEFPYRYHAAMRIRQKRHIYTSIVQVLWLSLKPRCDSFLYNSVLGDELTFVRLFH